MQFCSHVHCILYGGIVSYVCWAPKNIYICFSCKLWKKWTQSQYIYVLAMLEPSPNKSICNVGTQSQYIYWNPVPMVCTYTYIHVQTCMCIHTSTIVHWVGEFTHFLGHVHVWPAELMPGLTPVPRGGWTDPCSPKMVRMTPSTSRNVAGLTPYTLQGEPHMYRGAILIGLFQSHRKMSLSHDTDGHT